MFSIDISINGGLKAHIEARNANQEGDTADYWGHYEVVKSEEVVKDMFELKGHNRGEGLMKLCSDVLALVSEQTAQA